ncbi:MAG: hypothetical protein KGL39_29375 [Patescibacteria group bacterium]|nr:hypothetical protein [Patescibacteria group bacterium]
MRFPILPGRTPEGYEYDMWGRIKSPGKFEGEARYLPRLWHESMESGDWPNNRGIISIEVDDTDKALFPELARRKRVRMYEDEMGFVSEV